jgi:PAS domain S-box-containing protein
VPSVAARLASACQSALLGRTLKKFGGIVQVITEATPPYRALSVSPGWQQLCGYSHDDVLGRPLTLIQGPGTEPDALRALMRAVGMQMLVSVRLTNYTKSGVPFVHQLSCEPLRDPSGETRCFQATSLVLQAPGETQRDDDDFVASMPSICSNPVPPLWPLLGRAMLSDAASVRSVTHRPCGAPPCRALDAIAATTSARDGSGAHGGSLTHTGSHPPRHTAAAARGGKRGQKRALASLEGFGDVGAFGAHQSEDIYLGFDASSQLGSHESDLDAAQRARQLEIARRADELDEDVLDWLHVDVSNDSGVSQESMMMIDSLGDAPTT